MSYPSLFRRYLASLIDLGVIITLACLYASTPFYRPHGGLDALMLFVWAVSYEAVLTTHACTVGQAFMRFRVRMNEFNERVSLSRACLRVLVKYALGLISFLTLPARRDRRAIHDLVTGTIALDASVADRARV